MAEENITTAYSVRTGTFEGPLELLLSLIEQRKLFVNEISLAQVTDDYVSYIKSLSNISNDKRIADVSYFILIAATLILIKSKSLLPSLTLTDDETEKITDLERRLKLYQIIKTASVDIKSNFGTKIIFSPLERIWSEPLFSPDEQISTKLMFTCVSEVISRIPKPENKLTEVEVKKIISIDEVISSLTDRIQTAMNMSFKDFAKSHNASSQSEARVHIIVSFLAMLELVREGIIDVMQDVSFEDIQIIKQSKEEN